MLFLNKHDRYSQTISHHLDLTMLNVYQHLDSHFCKGQLWGSYGCAIRVQPKIATPSWVNGSSPTPPSCSGDGRWSQHPIALPEHVSEHSLDSNPTISLGHSGWSKDGISPKSKASHRSRDKTLIVRLQTESKPLIHAHLKPAGLIK